MIKVIVVDDSETIREGLKTLINRTEGYSCIGSFPECSSMLNEIKELNPDVLLIDFSLPKEESLKGIKESKKLIRGINDALLGGTYMNSSIAFKVIEYFNQKKIKTLNGEVEGLAKLEENILNKLTDGYNFKAIADSLGLSIETLQSNYKSIYKKLHVNSDIKLLQKQ